MDENEERPELSEEQAEVLLSLFQSERSQQFLEGIADVWDTDVRSLYLEAGQPYGPSDDDMKRWTQDGMRLSAMRKAQKARAVGARLAEDNDRTFAAGGSRRMEFERIRREAIAFGVTERIPDAGLELVWLLWDGEKPLILALPSEARANEVRRLLSMPKR